VPVIFAHAGGSPGRDRSVHVWIRTTGNRSDHSVPVGIDGRKVGSSNRIEFPPSTSSSVWRKATKEDVDATRGVSSIGMHTIKAWRTARQKLRICEILRVSHIA
jgi:hypothetical protein